MKDKDFYIVMDINIQLHFNRMVQTVFIIMVTLFGYNFVKILIP